MQQISTLILARWLLPIAPQNIILENHAVAINHDKIVEILPITEAHKKYTAKNIVERKNHVVMPCLINTHGHNIMSLFRGLADD